jgi:hypothetical protein
MRTKDWRGACLIGTTIRRQQNGVGQVAGPMPSNGEINKRFCVYKNVCCGCEIVIAEDMEFPDCPNHPRLSTIWKIMNTELSKLPTKEQKSKPAA